jgi:hypothetical protein
MSLIMKLTSKGITTGTSIIYPGIAARKDRPAIPELSHYEPANAAIF